MYVLVDHLVERNKVIAFERIHFPGHMEIQTQQEFLKKTYYKISFLHVY